MLCIHTPNLTIWYLKVGIIKWVVTAEKTVLRVRMTKCTFITIKIRDNFSFSVNISVLNASGSGRQLVSLLLKDAVKPVNIAKCL